MDIELWAICHDADGTPQWMLHSQDNLHSGLRSPVLLSANDITTLLPSNENDFANAREPISRAALEDTPPALENPALVTDEGRSLFAVLIQSHYYWGAICRRAINNSKSLRPWDPAGEYAQMEGRLASWERGLPNDYRWSSLLLKGYKQEGQDLVCCGPPISCPAVTLMFATGVSRGDHDHTSLQYHHPQSVLARVRNPWPFLNFGSLIDCFLLSMISYDKSDPELTAFWVDMARELFRNLNVLYEQIEAHYAERSFEDGPGAQMVVSTTAAIRDAQ